MLGERIAQQRLARNLTQAQIARESGLSKRTIVRLEQGESSQVMNLVRVLRVLGLIQNLEHLVPAPLASPIEALKATRRVRRRAAPSRKTNDRGPANGWTWAEGDAA